jgi:hypothetical protein
MNRVIELRQYTLHPGQRDTLIELFEREFVESQEAEGMDIIATFCDLDNPDRFVWLRGFPDMEARAKSLAAFYGGPVWKAHRDVANATMIASDNVLLLKPAWAGSEFASGGVRVPVGATTSLGGIVTATICYFADSVPDAFVDMFRTVTAPRLGAQFLAAFVAEPGANTFPALPVREGENVFVWFSRSAAASSEQETMAARREVLRLAPTARSRLRGHHHAGTA